MVLKSVFEEPDVEFYYLNLDKILQDDFLEEQKVDIRTDNHSIQSNIHYGTDLCIIHTKRYNKKPLVEHVDIKGPFVMIAYLISGELDIKRNVKRSVLEHDKLRIGFANSTKNKVVVPANCRTESILVYMRSSYFLDLVGKEEWANDNTVYNSILSEEKERPILVSVYITTILQQIMLDIVSMKDAAKINKHHIGLKIRELFLRTQGKENFQSGQNLGVDPRRLEKIKQAKAHIDRHYRNTPTIKHLSRLVLLNEMQLKKGFKDTYGTTIRGYIIDLKMKKAMELLERFPINEISSMLGYQSISHFTTTFKKYHGLSPSQIKK